MKHSEIIRKYYNEIAAAMVEKYRDAVECDGRVQYQIYIWDDGEMSIMEAPQGDNSYMVASDFEERELVHVTTIDLGAGFDIWDYSEDGKPEDEDEAELMFKDIVDYLVDSYEESIDELLGGIIADAEQIERYEEY